MTSLWDASVPCAGAGPCPRLGFSVRVPAASPRRDTSTVYIKERATLALAQVLESRSAQAGKKVDRELPFVNEP
jgi:hypothetical protein